LKDFIKNHEIKEMEPPKPVKKIEGKKSMVEKSTKELEKLPIPKENPVSEPETDDELEEETLEEKEESMIEEEEPRVEIEQEPTVEEQESMIEEIPIHTNVTTKMMESEEDNIFEEEITLEDSQPKAEIVGSEIIALDAESDLEEEKPIAKVITFTEKKPKEDSQDLFSVDLVEEVIPQTGIELNFSQDSIDLGEDSRNSIQESDESETSKVKPYSLTAKLTNFENAIFEQEMKEINETEMKDAEVQVNSQILLDESGSQTNSTTASPAKTPSRSQQIGKKSSKSPMIFESPMRSIQSSSEDFVEEEYKSNPIFTQHKLPHHAIEAINKEYQMETFPKLNFSSPIVDIAFSNGLEARIAICLDDQVFIYMLMESNQWKCHEFYQSDVQSFKKVIFTSNNYIMLISEIEENSMIEIFQSKQKLVSKLTFECKIVDLVTFSNILVVATSNEMIKYEFNSTWNTLEAETIFEDWKNGGELRCISIVPNQTKIFALSDCMVGVWDLKTCSIVNTVETYPLFDILNPLVIFESSQKDQNGLICVFLFKQHENENKQYHKCGLFFVSLDDDIIVLKHVYERKSSLTQSQSLTSLQVVSTAINQSNYLSVCTENGKVFIFNSRTTQCSGILSDLEDEKITCCKFHNHLPLFAACSEDGNLFIYYQEK
jgi:WD40 repeat protein